MTEQNNKKKPLTMPMLRAGASAINNAAHGRFERAVVGTVLTGIKMASAKLCDPLIKPLELLEEIKKLGVGALTWKPETLMAVIDRECSGWTEVQVAEALEHFHKTGELKTNVPALLRQKIYALRVIMTSDTVHSEWHIFEKVGGVFNDRNANFNIVEPLSPAECAATVAIIESIRPDSYSEEIKAYIAASCHESGIYSLAPSKYLAMADGPLQMMNEEETGRKTVPDLVKKIAEKVKTLKANASKMEGIAEEFASIQALKILVIDHTGDEAIR